MEQVRCTNCGSTAIIPDGSGEFCVCEACGSTFNVPRAAAFSKVTLDHTQDIRAWREYLAKQLKLQQESMKARDYAGVKLFAQKILSVLPDDFCARFYAALSDRYADNDSAFCDFLKNASFDGVTEAEKKEVVDCLCASVEPKYVDEIKAFVARAYPDHPSTYYGTIERNLRLYIQKLRCADTFERDVFICHRTAEPDQDIADAICTRLEKRGLRCWIAPRNILAGSQNYERDIIKGVESCRLFLLVSGFKSIYSEDCEMELKAAVLSDKALYSYRIDDTPYDGAFERALSKVQWLDASDDPYAHLEQLVIDIKGILARDEREKAELAEKRFEAREKERLDAEAARMRERERLERLESIVSGGTVAPVAAASIRSRLKRAELELQSGNFDRAQKIVDAALDADPENGLAWWLMLLIDMRAKSDDKLLESGADYSLNCYYENAERFASQDPAFSRRLDSVNSKFRSHAVKTADDALSYAERLLEKEDFDGLSEKLKEISSLFDSEDSIVYKKFPDVASRYHWLKLWAKYGQTYRVCVEDITRENEYKLAVRYASPAQAIEYESARETVSKNAQYFLRERSKNRSNDAKLTDYLVDNKNILPVDVYNHYSSLLYFRKMLDRLGMTEEQLKESTTDITTNEYFMLAQSLATDEQKAEYDALVERIERNRMEKEGRERAERNRAIAEKELTARHEHNKKVALTVVTTVTACLSYIFFAIAFIPIIDSFFYLTVTFLSFSAAFRLANDIAALQGEHRRGVIAFTIINLILNIVTIIFGVSLEYFVAPTTMFVVASVVFEIIVIAKYKKNLKRRE